MDIYTLMISQPRLAHRVSSTTWLFLHPPAHAQGPAHSGYFINSVPSVSPYPVMVFTGKAALEAAGAGPSLRGWTAGGLVAWFWLTHEELVT